MAIFDLVFEGGGAKGSVFVGALEVFFEQGHRPGRVVGTSAGAITAALLAAGYTPAMMLAAVTEMDAKGNPRFASFMDRPNAAELDGFLSDSEFSGMMDKVSLPMVPGILQDKLKRKLLEELLEHSDHFRQIFHFVECGGLYSGDTFVAWLNEKLGAVGVPEGSTLAQLHAQKKCDLSFIATDTTNREMLVLNHRTAPGLPVAMAVRMSMSIPFLWREVTWKESWGTYCDRVKTDNKIVDGGVLSNFPIDLVATINDRVKLLMGNDADPDANGTLGFLIDETLEVKGIPSTAPRHQTLRTVGRVQRLVDTMTGAHDNASIGQHASLICRLPAKGFGTTEFDMPKTKIEALLEAGRIAMCSHLALPKNNSAAAG